MTDDVGGSESGRPVLSCYLDGDVRRGRAQSVPVEDCPHLLRPPVKVARELHLFVSDAGDPSEGTLKVPFQLAAHTVQLNADDLQVLVIP
jgi:hypothetical protein